MNFTPTRDRLLIQRVEIPSLLPSGLVLPEVAKRDSQEAVIIAVGKGKRDDKGNRVPPSVRPGDRVLFNKYRGDEVTLEDVAYLVIREDDIIVVIDIETQKRTQTTAAQ